MSSPNMGYPCTPPPIKVQNSSPTSSTLLVKPSTCNSTSPLDTTLRGMGRQSMLTKPSSSTSASTVTTNKTTGPNSSFLWSSFTIMLLVQPLVSLHSLPIRVTTLTSPSSLTL